MTNKFVKEYKLLKAKSADALISLIHSAHDEGFGLVHGVSVAKGWLKTEYHQLIVRVVRKD